MSKFNEGSYKTEQIIGKIGEFWFNEKNDVKVKRASLTKILM